MVDVMHRARAHTPGTCHLALLLLAAVAALALLATLARAEEGAPPLTVLSPEEGLLTNSTSLDVVGVTVSAATVTVTVESSSEKVWNYETFANINGSFGVQVGLYEGPVRIRVQARDRYGSTNDQLINITLDTVPPQLYLVYPRESPFYTIRHSCTILVHITENDATVQPMSGRIELSDMPGVHAITVDLTEGMNRFEIWATDKAGNVASVTVSIVADWTPPVLNVNAPASRSVLTSSRDLKFAGNVTGAKSVVLDSGTSRTETALVDMGYLELWSFMARLGPHDGSWYYTVRAVDVVGNEASWRCEVTLDTTPPKVDIWPPIGNETDTRELTITGNTGHGVEMVLVNGEPYPVVLGYFSIPWRLQEGRNALEIEAWDATGNRAVIRQTVMCDDGPPELRLWVPRGSDGPRVHIRGTTDANVGMVVVEGTTHPVVNGTFDVVVKLVKGKNRITVEVVDPAGNARAGEAVVRYGVTGPEAGAVVMVVAIALLMGWVTLGWKDRRGRPRAVQGRGDG